MEEPLSLMYGIDQPTRCLVEVRAEQEKTQFLVGTLSLRQDNQLCLLEVEDDWLQISKQSFAHPLGEIWCLASSPTDPTIVATCYSNCWNGRVECGASLWKIGSDTGTLISLSTHTCSEGTRRCSAFEFNPDGGKCAIVSDNTFILHDIDGSRQVYSMHIRCKGGVNVISWNPHSGGNMITVAYDECIKGIDLRTHDDAFVVECANPPNVRSLNHNPNMLYMLASGGDDCKVSIWDIRKIAESLKTLHDHSHWVWSVRFNAVHDQLILSGGSDGRIFLNNLGSLSSESMNALDFETGDIELQTKNTLGDGRLEKLEEHEDSVYSCAWAGNDPWVFASLSLDGRVVVSRVKRHHKYAILRL